MFCIHFSVEEHLVYFQFLDIINNAAMNIKKHMSWYYVVAFFWVYAQEWFNWDLREYNVQLSEETPL